MLLPSISSAGTTRVRFYYGYSAASSASNGFSTFNGYFDDFVNLNNWTIQSGTWTVANGLLTVSHDYGIWEYLRFNKPAPSINYNGELLYNYTYPNAQIIVEFDTTSPMTYSPANQYNDGYNHFGMIAIFQNWASAYYSSYTYSTGTWYIGQYIKASGSVKAQVYGANRISLGGPTNGVANGTGLYYGIANSWQSGVWMADWLFLRNYSSTEPTTSNYGLIGPGVNWNVTPRVGTVGVTSIAFVDTSTNTPISWTWDFNGDGVVDDTNRNTSHTYTQAGIYTINHSVTNSGGTSWLNRTEYVIINNTAPSVNWNATPTTVNLSSSVQFVDMSTGTNLTTWNWKFNDGNVSGNRNLSHQFPNTGYYSINLSITDSDATPWNRTEWLNRSNYIHVVNNSITPNFVANITVGYPQLTVQFIDISTGGVEENWTWIFDGVSTSHDKNPIFTYYHPGMYSVNFSTCNDAGCFWNNKSEYISVLRRSVENRWNATPIHANLSTLVIFVDNSTSTGMNLTGWMWLFGDKNVSHLRNDSHIFPNTGYYNISHAAIDSDGTPWEVVIWRNRTNWMHIVNDSITTDFTSNVTSGTVPFAVQFIDISTGGVEENWTWIFDGSSTSHDQNPIFTYITPGIYSVNLSVCNDAGCFWNNKTNYIAASPLVTPTPTPTSPPGPTPPTVAWNATPTSGTSPLSVIFVDMTTGDRPMTYYWDFGDGNTSADRNATHIYEYSGTFTVLHGATNDGGPDSLNRTNYIVVTEPTILPDADFTSDVTSGNVSFVVHFTANYIGDLRIWIFDGNNISFLVNPSFTYEVPGVYSVNHIICTMTSCLWENKSDYITAYPSLPTTPTPPPIQNITYVETLKYTTTAYDYSPFVSLQLFVLLLLISISLMILSHLMPTGNDMFAALAMLFSIATLMGGMSVVILNEPTLNTVTNATSNYSYGIGGAAFNISIINKTYTYTSSVSIVSAMWLNAMLLVFVILMVLNVLYVYVRALTAKTETIERESRKDDYNELEIVYEDQRNK